MIAADLDRLSRTHVINVRWLNKLGCFVVVLSDGAEITWDQWCE